MSRAWLTDPMSEDFDGDWRYSGGPRPRIRTRLLFVVALIAIVPIAIFSVVTVQLSSNAVNKQAEGQIRASAVASATLVQAQLDRLTEEVDNASQQPDLRRAVMSRDAVAMRAIIELLTAIHDHDQLAFVVDPDGFLLEGLPHTPDAVGSDLSHRDWYRGVSTAQQLYLSEAYEPDAVGAPLVFVAAAPVTSPTEPNVVIGYVGVGQSLESLQSFVDDFSTTQDVSLTVADQAGTIVSAPGEVPTEIVSLESTDSNGAARRDGRVFDSTRAGQRMLSSTATVPGYSWSVTAEVSATTALAEVRRVTTGASVLAALLSLIVLAGLTALAWLLRGRHEAVEKQARSEAFLQSIIDNIPSIVVVKDAETLRIERINPAGEAVQGASPGELIGKNDADLVAEEHAGELMAQDREVLRTGTTLDIAVDEVDTPDGLRQFRTRKIPIAAQHEVPGFLLCIRDDITESVTALAELESAKSEAERANTAKSDFLSRMSHELRTPLNAVIGFGQLLELDNPTDDQRDSIDQILRGGRHLLGLINEILDLARIETGRLSMTVEPTPIEVIAEEALDLVRPLAAENGIDIPTLLVGDWSHWVLVDPQRLKQVLLNLLGNAIKYNRAGGRVDISCHTSQGRLRVNVTDTGLGIDQEQLSTMFAPFERLGAESSDVEGTGLGLSLSKSILEAMGGVIGVESEHGHGSTFWIDIELATAPRVVGSPSIGLPSTKTHSSLVGALVLYIEDNASNVVLVEQLLRERPDITLLTAKTGEEGAALAARHHPDLVLLDLNLPGVSGHGVLRHLRSRPETSRTPIIILSADATPTQIGRLLDGGADHYLTKPIDVAQLMTTVDRELTAAGVV